MDQPEYLFSNIEELFEYILMGVIISIPLLIHAPIFEAMKMKKCKHTIAYDNEI